MIHDNVDFSSFATYVEYLTKLLHVRLSSGGEVVWDSAVKAALDGQPSAFLRDTFDASSLRRAGAFFTGTCLASEAVKPLNSYISSDAVVFDPACGAGDLLIACAEMLPMRKTLDSTIALWGKHLSGRDIHGEFVKAAKVRLALLALARGARPVTSQSPDLDSIFPGLVVGCGLSNSAAFANATIVVMNPPFTAVPSPPDCSWGGGKINQAAVFLTHCISACLPGTRLMAILPDVIRSGTRYAKLRRCIQRQLSSPSFRIVGQFDEWADVDVFVLRGTVASVRFISRDWTWGTKRRPSRQRVGDLFDVSVGPVVDFRDARTGPWHPFLVAKGLPVQKEVRDASHRRRFIGSVFVPPFVVVRRTSRLSDSSRAQATLIRGDRPVAVENHLLVLQPKNGTLKRCRELVSVLSSDVANEWLNKRICCRHLTVSSLADLPWRKT